VRVVSLFSGAGGLDLGFIRAGHTVVWANDVFHDAVLSYRRNIGDHIVEADIGAVDLATIPDCDIVAGGFPCQGFSVANQQRSESDVRNKLYLSFLAVLKEKSPKYFLAENVKGILSLSGGRVFKMILSDFASAGYSVSYRVLNSADYGVPQRRERVIIVGIRSDIDEVFTFPTPTHTEVPTLDGRLPWVTVAQAMSQIPDPDLPHALTNHTYSKFKLKFNGYLGNRAIDPDRPAPTVTARGDDRGGVVVLHHPNNARRMSARELATVQSFELDFEFMGNQSNIYRQIGNAVPPVLAYHLAKSFKGHDK
jgi:DNA (cytosine-5)-methyltransferase 1